MEGEYELVWPGSPDVGAMLLGLHFNCSCFEQSGCSMEGEIEAKEQAKIGGKLMGAEKDASDLRGGITV